MPVTINGTTGIAGVDGSAGTPSVQGSDTNTGVFYPAADTVGVSTGGSERMRIDSSGNVGIGTTSPSSYAYNDPAPLVVANTTGGSTVSIASGATSFGQLAFANGTSGTSRYNGYIKYDHASNFMAFYTNAGAERMRIDSSGNLLVNTTTANGKMAVAVPSGTINAFYAERTGASPATLELNFANAYSNWNSSVRYQIVAGGSGGVYLATGATSWAAVSDERLKTVLTPFQNAVQKVCAIRAGTGRYLTDAENVSRSFLIAQDIQAVLPEAVDVEDDEQNTLGLRYTDTIPLLVAAIQELKAELDALNGTVDAQAAEIAALKANAPA